MRAGTLAKLAGFSAADMLKKAFTDERMRQIGAFVSGLAAGFYVDTEGVDDRVDGSGVRYRDGSGVLLTKIPSEASVPEDFVLLQTTEVISAQPVSQAGQTRTTATSVTASALTPDGPSALPSAPLRPPRLPRLLRPPLERPSSPPRFRQSSSWQQLPLRHPITGVFKRCHSAGASASSV